MDGFHAPRPRRDYHRAASGDRRNTAAREPAPAQPVAAAAARRKTVSVSLTIRRPRLAWSAWYRRWYAGLQSLLRRHHDARLRVGVGLGTALVVVAELLSMMQPYVIQHSYALGRAQGLLSPVNQLMAEKLSYDSKSLAYDFNQGFMPLPSGTLGATGPQIKAVAGQDPSQGVTVTDPSHSIDFTMTPQFSLLPGKQDGNRVIYPFLGGNGWAVYTMHSIGVKEDVVLTHPTGDTMTLDYKLNLGDQLAARVEQDGSVAIFGNTLFSGNVATGTANDAKLLMKARQNAPKNTLLFDIPAPTIKQLDRRNPGVTAHYSVKGDVLSVNVSGLMHATYPITIDPSIYVETAEKFMNGNNETNIDFDVADTLIQKGSTTGARFNSWNSTINLPSSVWGAGTAAAGGYIYTVGGNSLNGQAYSSPGTSTYVVPTGVSTVTVKAWGAGGGGGAGSSGSGTGGNGGGGGFAQADLSVTPGETLTVVVGSGGAAGGNSYNGGDGGGYSALMRGSTYLVQAGGGGGGGGGDGSSTGGTGGAGGGTSGVAGTAGSAGGGGGGTSAGGGTAGTAGNQGTAGASGAANAGGDAGGSSTTCSTTVTSTGGSGASGSGGMGGRATSCAGGGGGGGGRYGGGGGGSSRNNAGRTGGGGGGGSDLVTGSNTVETAGSGTTPGNSSDVARNGAGNGGTGGTDWPTATAGTGGMVVVSVAGGSASSAGVNWAKFSTIDGTIISPNPGAGICSGWCSTTAYNLPAPRTNLTLVAYNGFLYAIGGEDSSCTTANGTGDSGICKTVYIAKLGANGEPRLWHPTDTNQANWVYWYRGGDLSSPRSMTKALAYNNRMYLLGGKTSSGGVASVVSSVEEADVVGNGTLTSWTTSGMVSLRDPSTPANTLARYGFGAQVYNDHIYVIGGASSIGGAPMNSAQYITLNADGTMAGNWITTTSFTTGRLTNGGNFTTIWGAYIYLVGGCSAVNTSGYCTSIASDTQLASINADGSLDSWNTNAGVSNARMGHTVLAWRNDIYEVGGCLNQDAASGACTTSTGSINYGIINQDGEASTVATSQPSGSGTCVGANPTNCNLPGSTYIGNMLDDTAIYNGYLYLIGGVNSCTGGGQTCTTTTGNVAYTSISSTGTLTKPATCPGGAYQGGAWCVDSTHTVSGGIAASGTTVFNGRIYLIGGISGTSNKGSIYYVSINSDGSLGGNWTAQTTTALGIDNVSFDYAYARANPATAGTNPGNLYVFGGCTTTTGADCTAFTQNVFKCNIGSSGALAGCTTSGQLAIGTVTGATGVGLGGMAGTVYANYIYLIGGLAPGINDLKTVRYAKFDNNNNVVAASGSAWTESPVQMSVGRRRAAAFGYNGYIYVVGGYDGTDGTVLADIEFNKLNVSNGSLVDDNGDGLFNTSSVVINQRWGLSVPVSNSYAYVIGGCTDGNSPDCNTRTDTIQTFQVYNNDSGAPAGYGSGSNPGVDRIGASATILNGYIYYAGGCSDIYCTTATGTVYYAPIDANGVVGTWSAGNSLPSGVVRAWGKLVAAGGTLYYIGGQNSSGTAQPYIYYTTGFSSGNPTWSTTTANKGIGNTGSGGQSRTMFGAAVWNDRIYVVGGVDNTGATTSTVYVSPQLSSGGNIMTNWTTSPAFNVARSGDAVVAYGNNLYLFGGYDGSNYLSDVQYAQISSTDGSVGSWNYSTSLPNTLSNAEGFAENGYMYLIGGRSSGSTCTNSTLVAPISANTTIASGNHPTGFGEWYQTNTSFSGGRYGAPAVYSAGKAYVMGGGCANQATMGLTPAPSSTDTGDSTTISCTMFAATATGSITSVAAAVAGIDPSPTNDQFQVAVYSNVSGSPSALLGKSNSGTLTANSYNTGTLTTAVSVTSGTSYWLCYNTNASAYNYNNLKYDTNGSGTISKYLNNTTMGTWPATISAGSLGSESAGWRYALYANIQSGSFVSSTDRTYYSTLLSQPQVAKYSIMFDTDGDVFPQKWLLNGLDNSIGAAWQLSYRSMTNNPTLCSASPMTTWGQTTNFGNVTLGTPGVYTPLDGSGANTNCARYFYLAVTIDSSQAYGYPDDISRGPTITDLTLEFTADPAKRLMHGRTFTGGLQQPDDTPF